MEQDDKEIRYPETYRDPNSLKRKALLPTVVAASIPTVDGFTPTEAEVKLLRVLFDPIFTLKNPTIYEICEAAGIDSTATYYNALKKKGFVDTVKMYAVDPCKGKAKMYVQLLETHASNGSWPHLKALLAITGIYDEKINIEIEPVKTILRPGSGGNS
jgi:hypothetical protein